MTDNSQPKGLAVRILGEQPTGENSFLAHDSIAHTVADMLLRFHFLL